jgi:hypothetical protein
MLNSPKDTNPSSVSQEVAQKRRSREPLVDLVLGGEDQGPRYLSRKQSANYLGLSVQQLDYWRAHRIGPKFVKLARLVRYRRDWLDQFMDARAIASHLEINR